MRNERNSKADVIRLAQATAKGYVEVSPGMVFDFSYPSSTLRRGRVQGNGDICPTITTVSSNLLLYERYTRQRNFLGVSISPTARRMEFLSRPKNRIHSDVSPAVTSDHPNVAWFTNLQMNKEDSASLHGNQKNFTVMPPMTETLFPQHNEPAKQCGEGVAEESPQPQPNDYRIRRLTPRETLRLMDVYDDDIDRLLASGLSDNALYELAGNSIVVHCLYLIFRNMFIPEFMAKPKAPPAKQLSLFE